MTSRLQILIIEDNPSDYRLIMRQLSKSGLDFEAQRVSSAVGLQTLLGRNIHFDLILTDYALPDINIERKLSLLLEQYPNSPIIMVSGTLGEERAVAMLKAGLEDFVCKDNLSRLIPAINRALRHVEFKKKKQAAEERLRLWATVFEHAAEGIFITDPKGRILEVNRSFTEIMGYTPEEAIGNTPKMWKSGHHDRDFYQKMWGCLRETGQWRGEIWNRHKSGHTVAQWLTVSAVRDEAGLLTHYVAMFSDISLLKQTEQQLEYLAHHDVLTGLPNRMLLNARLEHAIEHAKRQRHILAVIILDLDRFKHINDSFGHPTGDKLLKEVARRLRQHIRQEDTPARLGGDEFCLLLERLNEPEKAVIIVEKILAHFQRPYIVEDQEIHITPSIGISLFPRDGEDAATLLRNADSAMYQAKNQGSNGFAFYSKKLTTQAKELVLLESALHKAGQNQELQLFFQPQLDMRTGGIIGAEALLRWEHPDMGMISPAKFIPLAEETGMILEIGAWVILQGCLQAKRWLDQGLDFGRIGLNISGCQINHGKILEDVKRSLSSTGLLPQYLELEVTEGFIMENAERSIDTLWALRDLGVGLSIDDFGTGYSSLAYLKRLPIHRLKIDQSFVRDIPEDPDDMAICQAVIALGHSLGLEVIAEGVETEEQRRFLMQQGCNLGQGYLFSRPIPAKAFEHWVSQRGEAAYPQPVSVTQ